MAQTSENVFVKCRKKRSRKAKNKSKRSLLTWKHTSLLKHLSAEPTSELRMHPIAPTPLGLNCQLYFATEPPFFQQVT
jgi:hypothetical protein